MRHTSSARRLPLTTLILSAALLLPACATGAQAGSGATPQTQAPALAPAATTHDHGVTAMTPAAQPPPTGGGVVSDTRNLRIALFQYSPSSMPARVGSPITWTNTDQIEHSVTHGTAAAPGDAFDSGFFTQGQHFTFTFTAPGEYPYFCTRHPSMAGLVQVAP